MGFDAAKRVEKLDYDFTTLDPLPKGLEDCKGVIPEPSVPKLQRFLDGYFGLLEMLNLVDPRASRFTASDDLPVADGDEKEDPDQPATKQYQFQSMSDALDAWNERTDVHAEDRAKAEKIYVDLLLDVCGGAITRAQIKAMPSRVRTAFLGWLVFELGPGKELATAMSDSLAAVKGE